MPKGEHRGGTQHGIPHLRPAEAGPARGRSACPSSLLVSEELSVIYFLGHFKGCRNQTTQHAMVSGKSMAYEEMFGVVVRKFISKQR